MLFKDAYNQNKHYLPKVYVEYVNAMISIVDVGFECSDGFEVSLDFGKRNFG